VTAERERLLHAIRLALGVAAFDQLPGVALNVVRVASTIWFAFRARRHKEEHQQQPGPFALNPQ
jgi:hypothetical protein